MVRVKRSRRSGKCEWRGSLHGDERSLRIGLWLAPSRTHVIHSMAASSDKYNAVQYPDYKALLSGNTCASGC